MEFEKLKKNNFPTDRPIPLITQTSPYVLYPNFTFLYSRKGEMRGTQNEGLFSGLD